MSYILDALRKADAERERDPARGIHAQPSAATPQRRAPAAQLWMLAAGAAVGVGAVAAYVLWERPVPAPVAPVAVAPAAVAPASPEPARELLPPPAPAVVTVATTVSPPAPPPLPAPAPVVQRPVTRPAAVTAAAVPAAAPAPAPTSGSAPSPATAAAPASVAVPTAASSPAPAPALPPANDRILAVAELPAGVQRELPKLAISGGVYSANSAQRMLIVGAQVVNEGAELAPGVLLEQIRPKSAVLKFKGYRYSVPF